MLAFLNRAKQERDAFALSSLVYSMMDLVETNMKPVQMVTLAVDVVFGSGMKFESRPVPFDGTWEYAWEGKMAVIHIDIEENARLLREYLYD